jgi:putative methionine-R-sulfoxide reductase with GAF domain
VTAVRGRVRAWLNRPQRTRGDELLTGLIGAALFLLIAWLVGRLLDSLGVIEWRNEVPLWLAALLAGLSLAAGILLARWTHAAIPQAHELYAEHLRDALADLRRLVAGEMPDFSLRDYIENGLFQPAHGRDRGEVRFSVLHPSDADPDVFVMSDEDVGLYPALGHSMEGRHAFSIRIDDSFSGLAFRTGKTQVSNDLTSDDRWKPHVRARPGREYEAMVSVPLVIGGNVDGVLNVLAVRPAAFEPVDQTYITLLASIIDVARSTSGEWE